MNLVVEMIFCYSFSLLYLWKIISLTIFQLLNDSLCYSEPNSFLLYAKLSLSFLLSWCSHALHKESLPISWWVVLFQVFMPWKWKSELDHVIFTDFLSSTFSISNFLILDLSNFDTVFFLDILSIPFEYQLQPSSQFETIQGIFW